MSICTRGNWKDTKIGINIKSKVTDLYDTIIRSIKENKKKQKPCKEKKTQGNLCKTGYHNN